MKPEWHVEPIDSCYEYTVKDAIRNKKYIKASISKDDIGNLLHVLLFLNDDYGLEGMMDIGLTDEKTIFEVSDELNELIVNT